MSGAWMSSRWSAASLGLLWGLAGCVTERSPQNETMVRAKGGISLSELPPARAAQVLAAAFPKPGVVRPQPSPESPSPWESALELFPEQQITDLEVPTSSLGEALRMLAEAGAVNLVLTEELSQPVQLSLRGVTLREAVRSLVRRYDLDVTRDGNVILMGSLGEADLKGRLFMTQSVSAQTLEAPIRSIASEEGQITISPSGNAVFVRDTPDRIQQIEEFLGAIDTPEPQVCIEVRILEVGFTDATELGFLLRFSDIDLGDAAGEVVQNLLTAQTDFVASVITDRGTIEAIGDVINNLDTIDLLSMPRVTVLSGRAATIEIITKIPYIQSTNSITTDGGATATATQQIEFEEVGIILQVTPVVQADGHVRLQVKPEVSEAVDFFQGVPVVDRRTVSTEVLVANDGTVFLGGLFRDNVFQQVDKIPLLGDIPFLGKLFRRTQDRFVKSELIVQITPRIVTGNMDEEADQTVRDRFDHLKREVKEKVK